MSTLGILGPDRLALIPQRYWRHHEFCFHLHNQVLELLVQYEGTGAHRWVSDAFEKAISEADTPPDQPVDLLGFLKSNGLVQHYKHHIVSHLVLGLTSDMLHFLYEALSCFERRKLVVGFALLRKPLKENLLFLSWLLADRDDFIVRFEKNTHTTLNGIEPQQRSTILRGAIDHLATREAFAADLLEDMIFSKSQPRGFEPIWQRASHLITKKGSLLKTEDFNINFIFEDYRDDHLYDLLYDKLPYLLLYTVQTALECFAQILPTNEQTVSHLILSTMGTYECLFPLDRRGPSVTKVLGKVLRPFLSCIHCGKPLRLTRENATGMYLREMLECNACELASPFPLYWLLSHAKVSISRDHGKRPILQTEGPGGSQEVRHPNSRSAA